MLKVITDMLQAVDRRQVSLLCTLDLSAAFDTVDCDILIDRLQQSFRGNDRVFPGLSPILFTGLNPVSQH